MSTFQEESYNETNCNITGEDIEISMAIKVMICFEFPLVVMFGGFLHYGIAFYDFNGGDSQKRGLLNQLMSYLSLEAIFHLFIQMSSLLFIALLGPINITISKVLTSIQMVCMVNQILVFSEQIYNRHMKIQRWKIKTKLSIEFWVKFYFIMNHSIGLSVLLIQLYLGEVEQFLIYQIMSSQITCSTKVPG